MCFLSFSGQKILSKCWMHKMSRKKPSCVCFFFCSKCFVCLHVFWGTNSSYFRKMEGPGIWDFVKSALFQCPYPFFLNLNKMCQKHIPIRGFNFPWSFWIVQVPFCHNRCDFVRVKSPFLRIFGLNSFILDKQGGVNQKEIQINLFNIHSILVFNGLNFFT